MCTIRGGGAFDAGQLNRKRVNTRQRDSVQRRRCSCIAFAHSLSLSLSFSLSTICLFINIIYIAQQKRAAARE